MPGFRKQRATERVDPWMSVSDAARALGISRQTVYNRCVAGTLEFTRIADRTVIARASVAKAKELNAA